MPNAEKELEEELVVVGNSLLTPPADVDELLRLLDKAESSLSRVEQSPSESMCVALHPAMKGLIAKELLGHSDADIKVAVASCISEITRITAPEAPYDDDLMKEIFQMIVKAFEKLDDISSRSYAKRVSILETVAKVRSCVVMLDLECDALILEMFHHFLRTIRDNHPENVFSSMEVIMTVVLEESEDISPELLSSLLMSVKKDTTDILPVAQRLAEKVIRNCAFKLKPCLMELVQSLDAPLSDYSKIVATVCQENSDVLEHSGLNASGECLVDDSKFSERTVSDELAQGSGKMESEVSCPEVGTASGRSPKSVMSNGVVQAGNDGCLVQPTSPNKKTERSQRTMLPKNASAARTEADKPDLVDVKDTSSDHGNKKAKRHKNNSALQLTNVSDEKGNTEFPNRKKGRRKEPDISQSECPSSKEIEPTTLKENSNGVEPQATSEKLKKKRASVISPSSSEKLPDTGHPKRGRPSGAKGSTKKRGVGEVGTVPVSPSSSDKARATENIYTEIVLSSKKPIEGISDSGTEPSRRPGKKQSSSTVDDTGKLSSYSHRKMEIDVGNDEEGMLPGKCRKSRMEVSRGDTSGKRQASKSKRQKSKDSSENEMVSSPMMADKADKDQVVLAESRKSKSGGKRDWEEISRTPIRTLKYDESLVGAQIKVWWPRDGAFYPGTVDSYNPVSKRHKVLYFDGDEEILLLKKERFQFIVGDEEEEEKNNLIPEAASEMPRKRAKKSDFSFTKSKVPVSPKSGSSAGGSESEKRHGDDATESTSGRRGRVSKFGNKSDGSTLAGSKSKKTDMKKSSLHTPKAGTSLGNELNKSTDGTPESAAKSDSSSKPGRKHKDDTLLTRGSPKGDASRDGSDGKEVEPRSRNKPRSETSKPGRKSKEDNTRRAAQKPKGDLDTGGKSDGPEDKPGLSRGQEVAAKVRSASRKLQENEGRSGKKRARKSQG